MRNHGQLNVLSLDFEVITDPSIELDDDRNKNTPRELQLELWVDPRVVKETVNPWTK